MKRRIRVTVPATTANLGPGFDVLGMALELRNALELTVEGQDIVIEIVGEGSAQLPRDDTNLVLRAMRLVGDRVGLRMPGFRLSMTNAIPLARGLGSSAAATVGGIALAAAALDLPLSSAEMLELAVQLEGHPDNVAPCLLGGLTVAIPGDKPRAIRLNPPQLTVVLLIPDVSLATSEARAILPATISRSDAIFNISRAALWVAAVVTGQYELLSVACLDRLHQPYRRKLMPYLDDVIEAALSMGAVAAFLSGAGTAVAALARQDLAQAVALSMEQAARAHGVGSRMVVTKPSDAGVVVETEG